ncbi:unknown similar to AMEV082 [Adoxophyes honmai entomopoxvirus 'L']|uniref:Uncharacterized protein n=1 Tax=Adoxophyes honmai entomopoxvirus 'L' TaxID=1293540 RepID=A0A916KP04_9POXV|nr:unknown similar to AMEV082 [Adoxophyes honmai entomopoxvirus 'L']CCU55401.1 unknown similar to AMEV082 [Adoxophyes honmai entomopoxvirus 'L']
MDNCDLINDINNIENNLIRFKKDINILKKYNKWEKEINKLIKYMNDNKNIIILHSHNIKINKC